MITNVNVLSSGISNRVFKSGTCGRRAPGFLELLLSANVCMRACVSSSEAMNN